MGGGLTGEGGLGGAGAGTDGEGGVEDVVPDDAGGVTGGVGVPAEVPGLFDVSGDAGGSWSSGNSPSSGVLLMTGVGGVF